jgi:hypothetical protein
MRLIKYYSCLVHSLDRFSRLLPNTRWLLGPCFVCIHQSMLDILNLVLPLSVQRRRTRHLGFAFLFPLQSWLNFIHGSSLQKGFFGELLPCPNVYKLIVSTTDLNMTFSNLVLSNPLIILLLHWELWALLTSHWPQHDSMQRYAPKHMHFRKFELYFYTYLYVCVI